MTDFKKNLNNYVEIFVGALFAVFGFSIIPFEEITNDTFFKSMLGTATLLVGVFYIFKANRNYKKRKKLYEENL